MTTKPEIAVVAYHLRPGRVSMWMVGGYGVPENYVDAVRRAGGRASLILPGDDRAPAELLDRFDGLLLVGGGDVEPVRYGRTPEATVYGLEPDRDTFEIDLLREADRRAMPTLCVCRGMQVLNVAFGGTLIQHLPDDDRFMPHGTPSGTDELLHDVKLSSGARVADATAAEVVRCSSHHHQGLDGLGEGLVATGWSEDGLVESIEARDGWVVGVQWHPEDTAGADPAQQGLFDELVRRSHPG
ncbi:MAG: gamma-glutamyl-gamma-aminobutyrate hydrolase family protein [Actinomycetota bacterium]